MLTTLGFHLCIFWRAFVVVAWKPSAILYLPLQLQLPRCSQEQFNPWAHTTALVLQAVAVEPHAQSLACISAPQHTVQLSSEVLAWGIKVVLAWGCAWGNKPCSSAVLRGLSKSRSWLLSYLCMNTFKGISPALTMRPSHTFKLYTIRDGIFALICL